MSLGGGDVVVAEFHARVEVVFVELRGLAQLFKGFLKTLESFVSAGQTPVSRSKLLVNLDRVAKLERSFLKLFFLQENFALFDVGYFCFFGIGAAADCEAGG